MLIFSQLREANLEFDSVINLKKILEPILILHAKDDKVVPFELGKKLFDLNKNICDIKFVDFEANLGLGHNDIYQDKNIADIVNNFVQEATSKKSNKSTVV